MRERIGVMTLSTTTLAIMASRFHNDTHLNDTEHHDTQVSQ
jgi:hypothetical protein